MVNRPVRNTRKQISYARDSETSDDDLEEEVPVLNEDASGRGRSATKKPKQQNDETEYDFEDDDYNDEMNDPGPTKRGGRCTAVSTKSSTSDAVIQKNKALIEAWIGFKEEHRKPLDEDPSWWWGFIHDRIQGQPENFGWLYAGLQETYESEAAGIYELIDDTEYRLEVSYPVLTDEIKLNGTTMKVFSHPDKSRQKDPNLMPSDFDLKALMTEAYMEKYAIYKKKNKAKFTELHAKTEPFVTTYKVSSDGTKSLFKGVDFYGCNNGPCPSHIRRFAVGNTVEYFLDITKVRELAAEGCAADKILPHEVRQAIQAHVKNVLTELNVIKSIPDTFGTPEMEPAKGFKLVLRSYQKRTLHWLVNLETDPEKRQMDVPIPSEALSGYQENRVKYYDCLQLGENGPYFDLATDEVCHHNPSKARQLKKTITCNGVILADDTGTGKTVTILALIHSKPFVTIPQHVLDRYGNLFSLLPSRATLIVCPSHLALQWRDEALRCIPDVKVHVCTTIAEYLRLSWNDVLFADIIITSVHFLQNQNYKEHIKNFLKNPKSYGDDLYEDRFAYQLQLKGLASFGEIKGQVLLSRILFYRIVSDEFHELGAAKGTSTARATRVFLKQLNAQFYIGVTGTPQYDTCEDVLTMARFLDTELLNGPDLAALHSKSCYEKPDTNRYAAACCVFMANMVRRNEPELKLPPLVQRCIWVDLTPQEQGVYHTLNGENRLMACNHHQLAQTVLDMVGDGKEMTIEEVSAAIQDNRSKRIATFEHQLVSLEKSMLKAEKELKELELLRSNGVHVKIVGEDEVSVRSLIEKQTDHLSDCRRRTNLLTSELTDTQRQFNFFQAVLDSLRQDQTQDCSICLEEISEGSHFVITRCGHIYCSDCMEQVMNTTKQCPMCREAIRQSDVMPMKKQTIEAQPSEEEKMGATDKQDEVTDCSRYGSKLAAFIKFMRKTVEEQPDAKFILFVQFRRLMDLIESALKEFNIPAVRCDGNVMTRNRAINLFKNSDEVRLILLSSEDSVSGLHLIEATHVVVFHPFMQKTHQLAMAYEKQGIARAWRGGQTHPVNLVRFIVRNSIEEELAQHRNYREGVITELDSADGNEAVAE